MGTVVDVGKETTAFNEGVPALMAVVANVEFANETGERLVRRFQSRSFRAEQVFDINPKFAAGDQTTVVWLPNQFEKTVQLYDFLELTPQSCLQRDVSPVVWPQIVLLLFAIFGPLFGLIYLFEFYQPLDFNRVIMSPIPWFGGTLVTLAIFYANSCFDQSLVKSRRIRREKAAAAGLPIVEPPPESCTMTKLARVCGAGLAIGFGLFVSFTITITLNGVFDRSKGQPTPVEIVDKVQHIEHGLLCNYQLVYRFPGEQDRHTFHTTPQNLAQFNAWQGIAAIHLGAFGWRWVKSIRPSNDPAPAIAPPAP